MFTRENIQLISVGCENMDSHSLWCRKMSFEQIIDEIFTYAQEINEQFSLTAYIGDTKDKESDVNNIIELLWCKQKGFYAWYIDIHSKVIEFDITDINIRNYGSNELPDYEAVIDKGLKLLNEIYECKK